MKNRPYPWDEDHFLRAAGEEVLITSMALWILSRTGQKTTVVGDASLFFLLSFVKERPSSYGSDAVYITLLWTQRASCCEWMRLLEERGKSRTFIPARARPRKIFCFVSDALSRSEVNLNMEHTCEHESSYTASSCPCCHFHPFHCCKSQQCFYSALAASSCR